ncbi:hypothetical protein SUDANB180_07721 (plasmid) [Streptomyces sp. enrichment culture]
MASAAAEKSTTAARTQGASGAVVSSGDGKLSDEEFYALADAEIEKYLEKLAAVPDSVLDQGGEATLAYLKGQNERGIFDLKCMGLIAAAVGGALIPAAKVVKVAKIVKKYGVKRVINAIKGVRKGQGQSLASDLKEVALIFLGVDEIKDACT